MWSKSARNLSKMEQSPAELLIILRSFVHVMSLCDFDLWPLDLELLQHFGCHVKQCKIRNKSEIGCLVFKLCTKCERNWINPQLSYWRFSTFSTCNFMGGTFLQNGSQGCVNPTSPNLARASGDHSYIRNLFQSSDILLHLCTREAQSWVMLKTTPNFTLFDPV